MNREIFMRDLARGLGTISEEERADAIAYYNQYFDDAGEENEQTVIEQLGNPFDVAKAIKANCGQSSVHGEQSGFNPPKYVQPEQNYNNTSTYNYSSKSNNQKIWIIVIAVLTLPLWAGIFGAIIGVIGGCFAALMGLLVGGIGMCIAGIVLCVVSIGLMITTLPIGLLTLGTGFVVAAVGLLLSAAMIYVIAKAVPAFCKWVKYLFNKIFTRGNAQ